MKQKQDNKYLTNELIQMHIMEKKQKGFSNKKYDIFFDGRVLQICFYSVGCIYSKNGSCIICDYGKPRKSNLSKNDIIEIMNEVFTNLKIYPNILLLNSLGSILDKKEMPTENFSVLLEKLSKTKIKVVIFEAHYTNINISILKLIQDKLPNKDIVIELGLESSNKDIRKKCLNKYINSKKFLEKVNLIKNFGFEVEANIVFGMPFLDKNEQIKDTISSIKWCLTNNIDKVDLFPINIKPYTILYKLYKEGKYSLISHADFIRVLKKIPYKYIDKIHLAWYGNRKMTYEEKHTIPPTCEDKYYFSLMQFYKSFNMNSDKTYRIELLKNINPNCYHII